MPVPLYCLRACMHVLYAMLARFCVSHLLVRAMTIQQGTGIAIINTLYSVPSYPLFGACTCTEVPSYLKGMIGVWPENMRRASYLTLTVKILFHNVPTSCYSGM